MGYTAKPWMENVPDTDLLSGSDLDHKVLKDVQKVNDITMGVLEKHVQEIGKESDESDNSVDNMECEICYIKYDRERETCLCESLI